MPENAEEGEGGVGPGGGGDDPGMSESEKLREKLETIAKTPAPREDSEDGLTQKEQEELDELEEDRRVEEELARLEARQNARSLDPFAYAKEEDEEDADTEVKEGGFAVEAEEEELQLFLRIYTYIYAYTHNI